MLRLSPSAGSTMIVPKPRLKPLLSTPGKGPNAVKGTSVALMWTVFGSRRPDDRTGQGR